MQASNQQLCSLPLRFNISHWYGPNLMNDSIRYTVRLWYDMRIQTCKSMRVHINWNTICDTRFYLFSTLFCYFKIECDGNEWRVCAFGWMVAIFSVQAYCRHISRQIPENWINLTKLHMPAGSTNSSSITSATVVFLPWYFQSEQNEQKRTHHTHKRQNGTFTACFSCEIQSIQSHFGFFLFVSSSSFFFGCCYCRLKKNFKPSIISFTISAVSSFL